MKMRQHFFRILCAAAVLSCLTACAIVDRNDSQMDDNSCYTDAGSYTDDSDYADAGSYIDNGCYEHTDICKNSNFNSGADSHKNNNCYANIEAPENNGYHENTDSYTDNECYTNTDNPTVDIGYIEDTGSWNHAWYVYWDTDVWDELLFLTEETELSSAGMFACYFGEDGQLYVPQGFTELKEMAEELSFPATYLSFVNDVQHTDGSAVQKDPEFLRDLWSDAERTEETVDAMLFMTRSIGADGIEIDFENIRGSDFWTDYVRFLELVWNKAQAEKILMRVVLGVSAPVEDLSFPTGPEYSVMCYNLYGAHSGPGPKADADFLKNTAEKFSKLQNVKYALATGGFGWNDNGAVICPLTQEAAETLAEESMCKPKRDKTSQALYYTYQENGEKFTVWYADEQTLAAWRSTILGIDNDAGFDLWRVGGNRWQ